MPRVSNTHNLYQAQRLISTYTAYVQALNAFDPEGAHLDNPAHLLLQARTLVDQDRQRKTAEHEKYLQTPISIKLTQKFNGLTREITVEVYPTKTYNLTYLARERDYSGFNVIKTIEKTLQGVSPRSAGDWIYPATGAKRRLRGETITQIEEAPAKP